MFIGILFVGFDVGVVVCILEVIVVNGIDVVAFAVGMVTFISFIVGVAVLESIGDVELADGVGESVIIIGISVEVIAFDVVVIAGAVAGVTENNIMKRDLQQFFFKSYLFQYFLSNDYMEDKNRLPSLQVLNTE